MKFIIALLIAAATLSACAGLDITPISSDQAQAIHSGTSKRRGYVVYTPVVMIKIGCETADKSCTPANGKICDVGAPFVVPDLKSPFLLNTRVGFGSAAVTLNVTDGWQLGQIANSSNNTQLLSYLNTTLQPLLTAAMKTKGQPPSKTKCYDSIYEVALDGSKLVLQRVTLEPTK